MVILGDRLSARTQLVTLAASEKGIKWKMYEVEITKKLEQLEPWYIKLNPKAYVPTALITPDNVPVCESLDIIKDIQNKFDGADLLIEGEKYQKLE